MALSEQERADGARTCASDAELRRFAVLCAKSKEHVTPVHSGKISRVKNIYHTRVRAHRTALLCTHSHKGDKNRHAARPQSSTVEHGHIRSCV